MHYYILAKGIISRQTDIIHHHFLNFFEFYSN
nr:MAG TPA: hypothetical protein [Caudoviricetes sp.]